MDPHSAANDKGSFAKIHDSICANDLLGAARLLNEAAAPILPVETLDKIASLENDFHLTLNYLKNGAQDPKRGEVLRLLRRQMHSIVDIAEILSLRDTPPHSHDAQIASRFTNKPDIERLVMQYKDDALTASSGIDALDDLCDVLDTLYFSPADLNLVAEHILNNDETPDIDKAYVVGVIGHNILRIFQPSAALQILKSVQLGAFGAKALPRAAAVIAASILVHGTRWDDDAELSSAISIAATDSPGFAPLVRTALSMLAKTNVTNEVINIFTNDIINEVKNVIKKFPDLNLTPDSELFKQLNNDSQQTFIDKFALLNNLAIDGIDVNFASQEGLRSLPFFQRTVFWIRPFDVNSTQYSQPTEPLAPDARQQLSDSLANSTICDSDRYAMAILTGSVPANSAKSMCAAVAADYDYKTKAQQEHYNLSPEAFRTVVETENFIKDLYRVANIRPERHGHTTLFAYGTWHMQSDALRVFYPTDADLDTLGSTLAKRKCHEPAASVYTLLFSITRNADFARKLAFCQYASNHQDKAIETLSAADAIDNADFWTKKTLAEWFFAKGNHALALKFFLEAETIKPLKPDKLSTKAFCQLSLGLNSEALNTFLGLTFTLPDDPDGYLGSALALFRLGRANEVKKYVDMAKGLTATPFPLLPGPNVLLGLAALAQKDYASAIASFHEAGAKESRVHLTSELRTLVAYNVPKNDIELLLRLL